MGILGLFGKKYIIGDDLSIRSIDRCSLYSSGTCMEDCWHYSLYREDGRFFVKTDLLVPGEADGIFRQKEVCEEITASEWRAVLDRFSGHVYSKDRSSKDNGGGKRYSVSFGWDGSPDGYRLDFSESEMRSVGELIGILITHPGERDIRLLREVSFGYAGDSIGSSSETTLFCENGQWYVKTVSSAGAGQKETAEKTAVGKEVMEKVREVISSYDWEAMEDLPDSEIFACDAATHRISFAFESSAHWRLTDMKALTDEASEMWRRVREIIGDAGNN